MTSTNRIVRSVASAALAAALGLLVWIPQAADSQPADLIMQGRQALATDKTDEAVALFEKAVAANPSDPAALAWLGSAQVAKAKGAPGLEGPGWVRRGFNTMDEAVERFPDSYVPYMVRGFTATKLPDLFKKAPAAVEDLGRVLAMREKNPQSVPDRAMPFVYLNLGIAYKKNGQPAEARAAWEKGKNLYPAAPEAQAIERELRNL